MIREARESDIPALLEMGERFAEAADLHGKTGYDAESTRRLFQQLIEAEGGILLVLDVDGAQGAAGGLVHPCIFNNAHLTGQELFWWVNPEWRGNGLALFHALEEAARAKGAQSWMMASVGLEDDRLAKIYARAGYSPSDRNYIKKF